MIRRVAVVTGGNRGIGLEICRQLSKSGIEVILTARNASKGEQAVDALNAQGLVLRFIPLDVTEQGSVRRLVKHLADEYGRTDILINNAGIYIDRGIPGSEIDLGIVRQTMETNFYGPLRLSQMCIPLMRRNNYGRIVNISSQMGALSNMGSGGLAYRVSKTALNAMTLILANELRGSNIIVNTVDPGWVNTDMGGSGAPRSVGQGADTAVWLATQPDGGPSGGYFRDRKTREW